MATIRLKPSTYYLSNSSYLSVSNASNMYTDTDSTSYGTVTNSQNGTTSYYIYLRGFDFDSIPSGAEISSFRVLLKAKESGVSTSSSYAPKLCNGTSQITSTCTAIGTTESVHEFTGIGVDFDTIRSYGSNFGIRINCRRASRNTTGYMYIYGAEIEITYTMPVSCTITSTLSGSGTIDPSGAYSTYEGREYTLTITPTNKADQVTAKKDGVDITAQLEAHYAGSSVSQVPGSSFDTGFSASGAQFYRSSSSTGTDYLEQAIGHSAENPYSGSNNTYVKDGGSNTANGWINYQFDFSSIPSNAVIDEVEVRVYGARESATIDSTHMARIGLYSGSTLKGTEQDFTSTTNSIMTITDPGTWTRTELQSARVRFYVAYYGGHVGGITFEVTYHTPGANPDYYTYTYTTTGSATIAVVIGSSGSVPPVITIGTPDKTRISDESGHDECVCIFTADQALVYWEARAVKNGVTPQRGVGVLVETGSNLAAGEQGRISVVDEELTSGDGTYLIAVYGQNGGGQWNE